MICDAEGAESGLRPDYCLLFPRHMTSLDLSFVLGLRSISACSGFPLSQMQLWGMLVPTSLTFFVSLSVCTLVLVRKPGSPLFMEHGKLLVL